VAQGVAEAIFGVPWRRRSKREMQPANNAAMIPEGLAHNAEK